jgi:hypothetical protein
MTPGPPRQLRDSAKTVDVRSGVVGLRSRATGVARPLSLGSRRGMARTEVTVGTEDFREFFSFRTPDAHY